MFLNKFKEVVRVTLGAKNVGSDSSIHRKRHHESVHVSTYKEIFELRRLISRVGRSITFSIRVFKLAGFVHAYKLRSICKKVITR